MSLTKERLSELGITATLNNVGQIRSLRFILSAQDWWDLCCNKGMKWVGDLGDNQLVQNTLNRAMNNDGRLSALEFKNIFKVIADHPKYEYFFESIVPEYAHGEWYEQAAYWWLHIRHDLAYEISEIPLGSQLTLAQKIWATRSAVGQYVFDANRPKEITIRKILAIKDYWHEANENILAMFEGVEVMGWAFVLDGEILSNSQGLMLFYDEKEAKAELTRMKNLNIAPKKAIVSAFKFSNQAIRLL